MLGSISRVPQRSQMDASIWVVVQELNLSYHNSETIFFTIYPYSGDFK